MKRPKEDGSRASGLPAAAHFLALGLALAAAAWAQRPALAPSGRTLDAVAAVVNGRAITTSQIEEAAWYARWSAQMGKPDREAPAPLTGAERSQALEHLITETLAASATGASQATKAAPEWSRLAARAGGEAQLERRCRRYHLSAAEVQDIMARQRALLAAIDARLGPQVKISSADIARYYREDFEPAARRRKLRPDGLAAATPAIRAILFERQMLALQEAWLASLRAKAHIRVLRRP